jgi:hypothetical protein
MRPKVLSLRVEVVRDNPSNILQTTVPSGLAWLKSVDLDLHTSVDCQVESRRVSYNPDNLLFVELI